MFLQCIQNVIKVLRTCFAPNIVKTLRRRRLNVAQTILRSCAGNIDETKCSIGGVHRVNDKGCGKHYQGSDPWIIPQLPEFVQRAFPGMFLAMCRTRQSHF
jgi:hypothetical protein